MAKNILLLAGGDGSEHDISLISSQYVEQQLKLNPEFNVISAVLHDDVMHFAPSAKPSASPSADTATANAATADAAATVSATADSERVGYFTKLNELTIKNPDGTTAKYKIDCAVPCLHGVPGETGDIQSFFELQRIPYIGCGAEASINCFNKVTTKFYLDALKIENTPSMFLSSNDSASLQQAHEAFARFGGDVYVKAANQGSSIGCYHVQKESELDEAIAQALGFSHLVLLEKTIVHRELEVAAYEYEGKLHITNPGEIIIPQDHFYDFSEKYSKTSGSTTTLEVAGLTELQKAMIKNMAERAFKGLNLRHLSRIDFFLSNDGTIYINEINTFPGMTPISMFPKLVEHQGLSMKDFLTYCIHDAMAHPSGR